MPVAFLGVERLRSLQRPYRHPPFRRFLPVQRALMAHTACVTGGSGYIAQELIKQLLEKGYNVRATLRDPTDQSKAGPLLKLADALPGTLQLLPADLLVEGSFDAAVAGSRYVFHVASPFFIEAADPQAQLIDPALKGTTNLLESVARHKDSVHRVVLTSSVAAVKGITPQPPKNGHTYSEEDWNETSTLEAEPYWLSKTLAEHAAWDLAAKHGLDLVTVLPNFVMGPVISAAAAAGSTSIGFMRGVVEGKAPGNGPVFADVRDVARAHILAAEIPSAKGRYIVSQTSSTPPNLLMQWLQERFPEYELEAGSVQESKEQIDNSKVQRDLGLAITPIRETLVDMAVTLVQLGIAKPKLKEQQHRLQQQQ